MTASSGVTGTLYAIFRVSEKKYKSIGMIKGFQNHMERLVNTPNANMTINNDRLIGTANIVDDVRKYIEGIKLRKNAVIARDLLLTASPAFFKDLTEKQKELWVQHNVKWLKDNFGENCIYATLHKDETTWHISSLIVPRFWDDKKQAYVLANSRYFDGIAKLSAWQDNYASAMKEAFQSLNRGVKFSKSKHVQIRQYYSLINAQLNENDLNSVLAKAQNSQVLEGKIRALQGTLNTYKDYSASAERDQGKLTKINDVLLQNLEAIKKDKFVFGETIKAMSEIYKIPQYSIAKIINAVEDKLNDNKEQFKDGPERSKGG